MSFVASSFAADIPTFSDEEYKARLHAMSIPGFDFQFTDLVKERILIRTERYRTNTERLLGLGQVYFPIFEHYLAKHNVPHYLKYLPIIESRMDPNARSYAKAVGLWQFIPSTARLYGMDMSSTVDDRKNIHQSTEAAARLLSKLYARYNDWALVLAAYNCGSVRVDRALKKAGEGSSYWDILDLLPKQTQKYVPYFIAVAYVGEHYHLHNLTPKAQVFEQQFTDTIQVSTKTSLKTLADQTETDYELVKQLNPSFLRHYVPASRSSQTVLLPFDAVAQLRGTQTLLERFKESDFTGKNPIRVVYRLTGKEKLNDLAVAHRCSVFDLQYWNNILDPQALPTGELLAVRQYPSVRERRMLAAPSRPMIPDVIQIPSLRVKEIDPLTQTTHTDTEIPAFEEAQTLPTPTPQAPTKPTLATIRSHVRQNTAPAPKTPKPVSAIERITGTTQSRSRRLRQKHNPKTQYAIVHVEEATLNAPKATAKAVSQTVKVTTPNVKKPTRIQTAQKVTPQPTKKATPKPQPVTQKAKQVTTPPVTKAAPKTVTPTPQVTTTPNTRARRLRQATPTTPKSTHMLRTREVKKATSKAEKKTLKEQDVFSYYQLGANESLMEVAKFFPNMTVRDLMELNNLKSIHDVRAGMLLKVRVQ